MEHGLLAPPTHIVASPPPLRAHPAYAARPPTSPAHVVCTLPLLPHLGGVDGGDAAMSIS